MNVNYPWPMQGLPERIGQRSEVGAQGAKATVAFLMTANPRPNLLFECTSQGELMPVSDKNSSVQ